MADYGTTTGVLTYTRRLLDGDLAFNADTRPTLTEVNQFLSEASAALNVALAQCGFSTPVTTPSTAVTLFDGWVNRQAVEYVESTQVGVGFSGDGGNRVDYFAGLNERAMSFVKTNELGLKRIGVAVGDAVTQGIVFTALDTHEQRSDPDLTSREQPLFRRRQWDNPE